VVNRDGRVLCRAETGGLVHALQPGGDVILRDSMAAIRDQCRAGGVDRPDLVFLGLTAIVPGTASEPIGLEIAAATWPDSERIVEGDGIIAWAGATGGAPGVAAMAGTGSVVVAINERGDRAETGGWAYLFGDGGSGWQIGSNAVRDMLRRWDRDRSVSAVGQAILEAFAAAAPPEVPDRVYAGDIDYREVAKLAEPVIALARAGDADAVRLVESAAADFSLDVAFAINRLGWEREPVLVGTLGGIFRAGPIYSDPFLRALETQTPRRVRLAGPVLTGLGGAAMLALQAGGIAPTPELVATLAAQGMGSEDA
jgi:N-acetylglucosamine kinase-like BadF-type ATPase